MRHAENNALKKTVRHLLRENDFCGHSFDRATCRMTGFVVATNMVKDEPPRGVIVYFLGYEPDLTRDLTYRALMLFRTAGLTVTPHFRPFCHPDYLHVVKIGKGEPPA